MDSRELDLIKDTCRFLRVEEKLIEKQYVCYMKRYEPEDILMGREERVYRQEELTKKYKGTLIVIRANYPGLNKNNYISLGIIKEISRVVLDEFKEDILYNNFDITSEGPIVTLVVSRDCSYVKHKAVEIEEKHSLGRCADIDVYDKSGNTLSRTKLGLSQRKCYICNDFAQNCVRSRKHSIDEVEKHIKLKYEQYSRRIQLQEI